MVDHNAIGHRLLSEFAHAATESLPTAIAAADIALERMAPRMPEAAPFFTSAQAEADWWVEFASDTQAAAMLSACLKRCVKSEFIATNARKRALVAVWNTMSEPERAAFFDFVEPGSAGKA